MTKLAAALATLFLIAAPPASAQLRRDSNPVVTATLAAAAYWHGTPCGGHVTIAEGTSEVPPNGALTSFDTPIGENAVTQVPATFTDCLVRLSPDWHEWVWDDQEYEALCQLMVHEFGHLEGFSDEGAQPGTVEYIHPDTAPLVAPCRHYRLLYYEHGQRRPDIYEYQPGAWG